MTAGAGGEPSAVVAAAVVAEAVVVGVSRRLGTEVVVTSSTVGPQPPPG